MQVNMNHVYGTMHVQKHDITRKKLISRLVVARLKEAKPKGQTRNHFYSTEAYICWLIWGRKKLALSKWST
jgi:hypothetical protein